MHYTLLFYERPEDFSLRTDPERQQEYWAAWPHYVKSLHDALAWAARCPIPPGNVVEVRPNLLQSQRS
jgi:hypothetical protein